MPYRHNNGFEISVETELRSHRGPKREAVAHVCPRCGTSAVENTTFCGKCGRQFKGEGVAGGTPQQDEMEPKHTPEQGLDPGASAWANREEAKFKKRIFKAAHRMSPVIVAIRPQSRNRFRIYVNGDRVWVASTYFMAKDAANHVINRLEDEGFEVIPNI